MRESVTRMLSFSRGIYLMKPLFSLDLSTSIARVMMAADFTMNNISAPLMANNGSTDDELAYNSTRDQVNHVLCART